MKNHIQEDLASAEVITWAEASKKVRTVNPALAEIIDEISPDSSYKLINVRYPFGSTIIQNNTHYLPTKEGSLSPASHFNVNKDIRLMLEAYGSIPIGVILNNSVELFMEIDDRIVPFSFYNKGKIFALWRHLDEGLSYHQLQLWNMTAGARSIAMMPKISDSYSHKKLQQTLGIKSSPPRSMKDDWALFVELYKKAQNKQPWFTEMLFFSHQWLDSIKNDSGWSKLYAFLLREAWTSSSFWRGQMQINLLFNKFIKELSEKNIKINSKHLDTIRHLVKINLGALPAFAPGIDDSACPLKLIQESYLDIYGLEEYIPTIMYPHYFGDLPVYYSLQWQTQLDSIPAPKTPLNLMTELEEVLSLMNYFMDFLKTNVFNKGSNPLMIFKNTDYSYFHNIPSDNKFIQSSTFMPKKDPRLLYCFRKDNDKIFCDSAQFVRGCVRISKEDN